MQITVRRGLDLEQQGLVASEIATAARPARVALLGGDYRRLHPALDVAPGDAVRRGQPLFHDRRHAAIRFTAPAAGRVVAIERGERRALKAVVIEVEGDESVRLAGPPAAGAPAAAVRDWLLAAGFWPAIRARPFSGIADPDVAPQALFVTAIETHPWAPDPAAVLAGRAADFAAGCAALAALSKRTIVCTAAPAPPGMELPPGVEQVAFAGPHPAGLPGTHIERLAPVTAERPSWYVGYQDVLAIGTSLRTGELRAERVVALAGPAVERPGLVRCVSGIDLATLTAGRVAAGAEILAGSLLAARRPTAATGFLGRFELGLAAFAPDALPPASRVAAAAAAPGMIALEAFEAIWPFGTPPLPLLRALLAGDSERAEALGCLGLDEEDLALAHAVCPVGLDYGAALRAVLDDIARQL